MEKKINKFLNHFFSYYRSRKTYLSGIFLLAVFFIFVLQVKEIKAADMYFSPAKGSFRASQSFTVNIHVNSSDQAMNAMSGVVSFPVDKLEVVSLSKTGSIVSFWVQEPSFSNSTGVINFEGVIFNPGFSGSAGRILSINFRAKESGQASLRLSSGAILANDGQGTNILVSMGQGNYQIAAKQVQSESATSSELGVEKKIDQLKPENQANPNNIQNPLLPVVSSSHGAPDSWSSHNKVVLSWLLPSDVEEISYELNRNPKTNPKFSTKDKINQKTYSDLLDGVWYFHINFKNQFGWGEVMHYKIMIDSSPPLIREIKFQIKDSSDPNPRIILDAKDNESSVVKHEIHLSGNGRHETYETINSNFQLPKQSPGKYQITVKSFNGAGNYTVSHSVLEIVPIGPLKIISAPSALTVNEPLFFKGHSLSNVLVKFFLKSSLTKEIFTEEFFTDKADWSYTGPANLPDGKYEAWFQIQDERGALSLPSEKIKFSIDSCSRLNFGKFRAKYSHVLIIILTLLFISWVIIGYSRYQIYKLHKKLKNDLYQNISSSKFSKKISSLNNRRSLLVRKKEPKESLKRKLTK